MAKKATTKAAADPTTEEKIKEAARKVFTKKGYAATRTRDIAEEAGINLALLNYYFRSKEKLFDIVMLENIQKFLMGLKGVLNNKDASLNEKVVAIAVNYIDLLKTHPDLPIFILSEIRANPEKLAQNMAIKSIFIDSHFFKQLKEKTKGKINPLQFMINIMGLTVFPFVARPLLQSVVNVKQMEFDKLMEERKKLIPLWVDGMLNMR
jgi:AcrR family transcriptional regulator